MPRSERPGSKAGDSVVPNIVHEQKLTIAQVFRLRLNDSAANGVPRGLRRPDLRHAGGVCPIVI
jgi:hypothetical protein